MGSVHHRVGAGRWGQVHPCQLFQLAVWTGSMAGEFGRAFACCTLKKLSLRIARSKEEASSELDQINSENESRAGPG
jgi:hypothetical protein